MAKIKGTRKADTLEGTSGNDLISGLGGNDQLIGGRGGDMLYGGRGDDTLFGGRGDDTMVGKAGDDTIHMDGGVDVATAGVGDDTVIVSNGGRGRIATSSGEDEVQLDASARSSTISLGSGNDSMTIAFSTQKNQTFEINGGSGVDVINFAGKLSRYTVTNDDGGLQTVTDNNGNTYIIKADALSFAGIPYTSIPEVNRAPVVANAIADRATNEDAAFSFQIPDNTFNDPDGDTLTYTVTDGDGNPLPTWLTFNAATRTFSGTPTNDDVTTLTVIVKASDGDLSSTDTFKLTINNTNDAPTGAATATLAGGMEDLSYTVSTQSLLQGFSDADGDALGITGLGASNGATVTDNNDGTWTITPATNFNGDVALTYNVVDGNGGTKAGAQTVAFAAVNDAPVLAAPVADQTAVEGQAFSFQLAAGTFTDVDNASLTLTATLENGDPLPSWLSFDADTRSFSGTPGDTDSGNLAVRITGSDGSLSASDVFTIKINDVPPPPFPEPSVVNGVLKLVEDYDYDLVEAKDAGLLFVKVDGKTFTFDSASVQSILTEGSHSVDIDTRGFAKRNIDGDVNFTNVTFVQANLAADSKFESSFEFGGFNVDGNATVNGNMADFFKAAWDYIDDHYSYYDEAINSFAIDIGIKYAQYLNAGGAPLTDIVAKYTADNGDAGSVPQRLQTMHDNLLGNFDENSIADKFSDTVNGDNSSLYTAEQIYQRIQDAGLGDLLGVIGNIHDGRGIFSGNEGDIDGTGHNQVRVFDYQHGWDRPDFISFDSNGRVDSRAINVNEMYFGDGNTPNNYVIEQHEGAGVETALKVHFRTGNDILPSVVGADGTAIFVVPEGPQLNGVGNATGNNPNRAAWSFDYSLVAGLNGAEGDIDNFDFQLKVDTDKGAGVNYMVFNLEGSDGFTPFVARNDQGQIIAAFGEDGSSSDGSNTDIAQDSVNFGFNTIKGAIGGGYAFGKGEFDIELTSFKDGTDEVLSNVHIRVIVDSDQFML